jgi:hypothetical protein
MILRELFYFNRESAETETDNIYNPTRDSDVMQYDDTRKTRLTLGQINELRLASEQHLKETEKELEFISRMYAAPPAAE